MRHSNIAYCNGFCILVAVCTLSADVSLVLLYAVGKISFHHCNYARFKGLAWYIFVRGEKKGLRLNSGQERMDLMKSWAGIEEEKAGRSVCCVMQSVRVLVMCCGIVLHTLVLEVPSCWS